MCNKIILTLVSLFSLVSINQAASSTLNSGCPFSAYLESMSIIIGKYLLASIFGLLGLSVIAFVYYFVIRPYLLVQFYRKQGIPMFYSPVIGSFSKDLQNAREKGEFYYDWIQLSKQEPRPKAMGKNVAADPQLYLIDPEAIRQFFINHESYIKHPFLNALTKELGKNGLVMAEGRIWRKHRKLLSTGFQYEMLKEVIPEVRQHSLELIEQYKNMDLNNFKAFDAFKATAGEVIGRIFFEESLGRYTMQGKPMTLFLADLIARISSEPYNPLYLMFGIKLVKTKLIPRQRKMINDIREFREWCRGIVRRNIQKRKEDHAKGLYPYNKRKNMFDIMFDHQLANPEEALSEEEMIDEYITFFSDGVYTTGHFITMLTYYLEMNPEWKKKVIDEMDSHFNDIEDITYEKINKLDILAACMKESLRLAPPVVTAIERIALHDHDLAGIKVKKGTILMACHCANHLDDRFFEDAATYNPERWIKPSKSQESVKAYPSLFVPFSLGARHCIGQNFAMNEAKIILAIFFKKFKYELADKNYQLKFTQRFLREPLEPIVYKLTPRDN